MRKEEPDLEDEALKAELASLAALRAQREKEAPSAPRSERATPRATPKATPRAEIRITGATADALLSRAEQAENTVDREIEEMDRELQRQVAEFRKQQRRDSETSQTPCEDSAEPAPCPPSFTDVHESAELRELKDLAAKMEEAFPEGEGAAPSPPTVVDGEAQQVPDAELEDTEVTEFKSLLDQLDLRLRALQSKEVLKLPLDEAPASLVPKGVVDTLEGLRSQNRYLREQLGSERRKGKLGLDHKLLQK
ncbi:HERC1 [Symbiodinium natans]|uniref:HERC1 protein n=1 Tax=Symbiodinium natans TaxID=878477 RepID=A0A812L210_9DINO|nr:HERC1 [Symbiodinium natans]